MLVQPKRIDQSRTKTPFGRFFFVVISSCQRYIGILQYTIALHLVSTVYRIRIKINGCFCMHTAVFLFFVFSCSRCSSLSSFPLHSFSEMKKRKIQQQHKIYIYSFYSNVVHLDKVETALEFCGITITNRAMNNEQTLRNSCTENLFHIASHSTEQYLQNNVENSVYYFSFWFVSFPLSLVYDIFFNTVLQFIC